MGSRDWWHILQNHFIYRGNISNHNGNEIFEIGNAVLEIFYDIFIQTDMTIFV